MADKLNKIKEILRKGGYDVTLEIASSEIYHKNHGIIRGNCIISQFTEDGTVKLNYIDASEFILPSLLNLYDFCMEKGLVHTVSGVRETRDDLVKRKSEISTLINRLNDKMGYGK